MENTLEFEIPEGYEIDKEQSTNKKVVYKKVEKYEPKVGDLVYSFYADCVLITLVGGKGTNAIAKVCSGSNKWFTMENLSPYPNKRPATADETELFTRILDEKGYEYDPEKKKVWKKMWRAEVGNYYYFIDNYLSIMRWRDDRSIVDNYNHAIGNYFRTCEEAEEVAEKFREILNSRK